MGGEEKPTSGPVSLAGLTKLQPNRKKFNNRSWRPLKLSDFGDDENNNDGEESDHDGTSSLADDFNRHFSLHPGPTNALVGMFDVTALLRLLTMTGISPDIRAESPYPRPTHLDLPPLLTTLGNASPASQPPALPSAAQSPSGHSSMRVKVDSEDASPTDVGYDVADETIRVFGKQLPDPVLLSTNVGQYDGEVIFIGHPSRDVSAHQWSQASFQWVGIGSYSPTQRVIEGALSKDRLRDASKPPNTLEYFKAVAEQRQKLVQVDAFLEHFKQAEPANAHRIGALRRPALADQAHFASLSSISTSTGAKTPTPTHMQTLREGNGHPIDGPPSTITGKALEDPFVTPATKPQPVATNPYHFGQGEGGSLDFNYQFPAKPAVPHVQSQPPSSEEAKRQVYMQREKERIETMHRKITPGRYQTPQVRGAGYGDEATSSARRSHLTRPAIPMSPEDTQNVQDRLQLKERLHQLGASAVRSSPSVAQPEVYAPQGHTRALFPPQGPTVANPTRVTSTLNANAQPYTYYNDVTEESESEATSVNPQPVANLRFSDPDNKRKIVHEIVNGSSQQAPTPQNFKGPWFTDEIPTTLHPTTALAVKTEEDAKLRNWFTDGQRPARLQDYTNRLMQSADIDAKARNAHRFGAIGEHRAQDPGRFANTSLWVYCHENLAEYVEASKGDLERDYWTRKWKATPAHVRDRGLEKSPSIWETQTHESVQGSHPAFADRMSWRRPADGGNGGADPRRYY